MPASSPPGVHARTSDNTSALPTQGQDNSRTRSDLAGVPPIQDIPIAAVPVPLTPLAIASGNNQGPSLEDIEKNRNYLTYTELLGQIPDEERRDWEKRNITDLGGKLGCSEVELEKVWPIFLSKQAIPFQEEEDIQSFLSNASQFIEEISDHSLQITLAQIIRKKCQTLEDTKMYIKILHIHNTKIDFALAVVIHFRLQNDLKNHRKEFDHLLRKY